MAQLPRRKCRFLWFIQTFKIIKNEQFINASIVAYSRKLLSCILEAPEYSPLKKKFTLWRNKWLFNGCWIYQNFPWMLFSHNNHFQFYKFLKKAFKGKKGNSIFTFYLFEAIHAVFPAFTQINFPPCVDPWGSGYSPYTQPRTSWCLYSFSRNGALRVFQDLMSGLGW